MSRKEVLRLQNAICGKDLATVKSVFVENPSSLNEVNDMGQNPFHILASVDFGGEDNELGIEVAKVLLGVAEDGSITEEGKVALKIRDQYGYTPLHLAAKNCLPSLVEAFQKYGAKPEVLDSKGRTPLHYASEYGDKPKGRTSLKLLLQSSSPTSILSRKKGKEGKSAFMLAISNCCSSTNEKYDTAPGLGKDEMMLLYKHYPLVLKRLMDLAVTQSITQKEGVDVIDIDYGPIVGYNDEGFHAEGTYLYRAQWWEFAIQKEIVGHPLVNLYLARKGQKMRGLIFSGVLMQILVLAAYMTLLHSVYFKEWINPWSIYLPVCAIVFNTVLSCGTEMLKLRSNTLEYFVSPRNWLPLAQIIVGFIPIFPVFRAWIYYWEFIDIRPTIIETYFTAVAIVLAFTLAMVYFGGWIEAVGYFTEMLKKVVLEIIKVLVCFAPLVLGFTYAFKLVFVNVQTVEATFLGPLINIIVLMTGELDYKETFEGGESLWEIRVRLALFLLFLITIPIACFNLITGVALQSVMDLKERMTIIMALYKLEHVTHIEFVLLDVLRDAILCPCSNNWRRNIWRKFNVAVTKGGKGDLDFETLQKEYLPKWEDRPASLKERLIMRITSWWADNEINPSLRNELRDLAAQNSMKKDLQKLSPSVVYKVKKALMRQN